MKKIYFLIFTITTTTFFYTLTFFLIESIDLAVPNAKESLIIKKWDGSVNSKTIYATMQDFAIKEKVNIHKTVFSTDEDGKPFKKIFTFSFDDDDYQYENSIFETKTKFYDSNDLDTENVVGVYYFTQKGAERLANELTKYKGLKINIEKIGLLQTILYSFFTPLGVILLALLVATIFSGIFNKISDLKKMGIWEISGKNVLYFALQDSIKDLSLYLCITIVYSCLYSIFFKYYFITALIGVILILIYHVLSTFFVNKIVSIPDKIKGKKPYIKFVYLNIIFKLALIIIFIIFSNKLVEKEKSLDSLSKNLSNWEQIDNYYRLYFSNTTTLFPDPSMTKEELKDNSNKANKIMSKLLINSDQKNGILSINNEEYVNKYQGNTNFILDSGSFLIVNHNFLKVISITDFQENKIKNLNTNNFYCLIPENKLNNKDKIVESVKETIAFNQNMSEGEIYTGDLNIIVTKKGQKIFNFNSENLNNSISEDPIVLVGDISSYGNNLDIITAEVSSGNYLFSDKHYVNEFIKNNKISNEFFGLISIKDEAMNKIQQIKTELKINRLTMLILFLMLIIIIFFVTLSYIEIEKKLLFIQYINGYTFFSRHIVFFLIMLSLTIITIGCMIVFNRDYLISGIIALIIETIILLISLLFTEINIRTLFIKKVGE